MNGSYIFCQVIYEDVSALIGKAKKAQYEEDKKNINENIDLFENYMEDMTCQKTEISKHEKSYYFPVTLAIKSRKNYQREIKKFLKALASILEKNPFHKKE